MEVLRSADNFRNSKAKRVSVLKIIIEKVKYREI